MASKTLYDEIRVYVCGVCYIRIDCVYKIVKKILRCQNRNKHSIGQQQQQQQQSHRHVAANEVRRKKESKKLNKNMERKEREITKTIYR